MMELPLHQEMGVDHHLHSSPGLARGEGEVADLCNVNLTLWVMRDFEQSA